MYKLLFLLPLLVSSLSANIAYADSGCSGFGFGWSTTLSIANFTDKKNVYNSL